MSKVKTRSSVGQFDVEIGKRIRLRRLQKKMSQSELAAKVGVTFQQVQKYESGQNRPGTDRLIQISKALDVPLSFFVAVTDQQRKVEDLLFIDPVWGVRLMRAYARIKDRTTRKRIVFLVEGIADD